MSINSIIFQSAAIGDYLFLILIIVASIIQAITQNKKKKTLLELDRKKKEQLNNHTTDIIEKKRPETMTGYEPPAHNIFDSIERMLVPELEDEQYGWGDNYAEAVIEEKSSKEEVTSSNSSTEKLNTDTAEKQASLIPQKTVFDMAKISHKSRIREGFNLKKAVVYSEILNRKYT